MLNIAKARVSIILICATVFYGWQPSASAQDENQSIKPWAELISIPQYSCGQSLRFCKLKTTNDSRAALVTLDLNDRQFELLPFFCEHLTSPSDIAKKELALAATNGGFFNLSNGESTSYIVINGKSQCDPTHNKSLVENPKLQPYLETIFNRSELRIMEKEGKRKARIMPHNAPIPEGWTLVHSMQGGPQLLPTITEDEEVFVRKTEGDKIVDSIGSHRLSARTAIGITPDNHILLLCVASKGQQEFSSGVTLAELATTLRDLGCTHALNLDGGTSTTMVVAEGDYRDASSYHLNKVIAGNPEKMVKSGLIIVRGQKKRTCPY